MTEPKRSDTTWLARTGQRPALAQTGFLYGGNAAYIEDLYARFRPIPSRSIGVAGLLRRAEGRQAGDRRRTPRARPGRSRTGRSRPAASWSRRSTATGPRSRRPSAKKLGAKAARRPARRCRRRCPVQRDPRFRPGDHDDPRLSHARPSARPPRPARHRQSQEDYGGAVAREPTASPRRISTARSSSTTCSAWSYATIREMLEILKRTYCSDARRRVHAHLRSGRAEGLDPGAHRGAGQGRRLHRRTARRRSCTS
jgi:2-oxoglutarate dehydrogenase E1 component